MTDILEMWVVYDHPKDHPNHFIARRWDVKQGGGLTITRDVIITSDLNSLRIELLAKGKSRMERRLDDDPVIKEIWL